MNEKSHAQNHNSNNNLPKIHLLFFKFNLISRCYHMGTLHLRSTSLWDHQGQRHRLPAGERLVGVSEMLLEALSIFNTVSIKYGVFLKVGHHHLCCNATLGFVSHCLEPVVPLFKLAKFISLLFQSLFFGNLLKDFSKFIVSNSSQVSHFINRTKKFRTSQSSRISIT